MIGEIEVGDDRQHCCEEIIRHLSLVCDLHTDVFDCPDTLVYYYAKKDVYGLIVHDGGSAFILIKYCPWCGAKLPGLNLDD